MRIGVAPWFADGLDAAHHSYGLERGNPLIELQVLLVVLERRNILQITLVLRENRGAVLHDAEGGLQLASKSQQVGRACEAGWQRHSTWGITACTSNHRWSIRYYPHDRIIDPVSDIAIVHQHGIGDAPQADPRGVETSNLRLVGNVAAGHDKWPINLPCDQ